MAMSSERFVRSSGRLVAAVCAAQVLVQIGAFFWPALMPGMMPHWKLTNSEAGWITASFYGAYLWLTPSSTASVHSMLGYAGGFVGLILVGWILDLSGGTSRLGWGMSFFSIAMLMALALFTFWVIWPRELAGDKAGAT
jgi:hypothetical protein